MFDIGFLEIAVILILALLVLGPERLPKAARSLGYWFGKARRYVEGMKAQVEAEFDGAELKRALHNQEVQIRELQSKLQNTDADIKSEYNNLFDESKDSTRGEDAQGENIRADEDFARELSGETAESRPARRQYEMIEEDDERWDQLEEHNTSQKDEDSTADKPSADKP
ncbi:MAG TPA: Sec-independent protein translocase protein TatB [Gammaproteobacteria bacterium]